MDIASSLLADVAVQAARKAGKDRALVSFGTLESALTLGAAATGAESFSRIASISLGDALE